MWVCVCVFLGVCVAVEHINVCVTCVLGVRKMSVIFANVKWYNNERAGRGKVRSVCMRVCAAVYELCL